MRGFLVRDPAFFVGLLAARDRQRVGRHVLRDRRASRDIRSAPDPDRCNQLRVAADECAVFDHRRVLGDAVVVAGDRAGADVDVLADGGVAEVGEVARLRSAAERGFLQLDEVSDVRVFADLDSGRRRANGPTLAPLEMCEFSITQKLLITTRSSIDVSMTRTPEWISQPDPMRVWPSRYTPGWMMVSAPIVTSGSMNVVDGSTMVTPAAISASSFVVRKIAPTSASSFRLFTPRISRESATRHGLDGQAARPVDPDKIWQVVLTLGIRRSDLAERAKERRNVERIDSAVDLPDLPLPVRRVLVFDD